MQISCRSQIFKMIIHCYWEGGDVYGRLIPKATTQNIPTDFNSYRRCRFMVGYKDVSVFTSSPLISTCLLLPCHSLSSPRCCVVPKLPSSSHKTRKIGSCGVRCEWQRWGKRAKGKDSL